MFNIQLFGTNDTITASTELKLEYLFDDQDTRTTSLSNPRSDISGADILETSAVLLSTQAFVGDKNGAAFTKISSAKLVETQRVKLDIS